MALSLHHTRVVLSFAAKSGIARDASQVTLYFRTPGNSTPVDPGSGTALIDGLAAALTSWLVETNAVGGNSMGALLGPSVSRATNSVTMELFHLPNIGPPGLTGPPYAVRKLSLSGTAPVTGFPSEVAAVLTYHADLTQIPERGPNNTRPASNRRGRFYWGPLGPFGTVDATTGRISIGLTGRQIMTEAARTFLFGHADAAGWRWVVFSRKLWQAFDVAGVFCNDAFDTQRRRGEDPTVKTALLF